MLYLNTNITQCDAQQLNELLRALPLWRRELALRYKRLEGRRESVLAYMELCRGLKEEYGIQEPLPEFAYGPHGKPSLPHLPHIHFSLSHCAGAVGCLLAKSPCGLDIECLRPLRPALVRYTMSEVEAEAVLRDPRPDVAFMRLWTQKEAVLKLRGTGVQGGLKEALTPASLRGITLETHVDEGRGLVISTAINLTNHFIGEGTST